MSPCFAAAEEGLNDGIIAGRETSIAPGLARPILSFILCLVAYALSEGASAGTCKRPSLPPIREIGRRGSIPVPPKRGPPPMLLHDSKARAQIEFASPAVEAGGRDRRVHPVPCTPGPADACCPVCDDPSPRHCLFARSHPSASNYSQSCLARALRVGFPESENMPFASHGGSTACIVENRRPLLCRPSFSESIDLMGAAAPRAPPVWPAGIMKRIISAGREIGRSRFGDELGRVDAGHADGRDLEGLACGTSPP